MGFFDRWSKNDDGSFTDTESDSGGSSSSDDDDGTRPGSSVPNNLSGGSSSSDDNDSSSGSPDDDSDSTPEPTTNQEQLLDGSTGGSSSPSSGSSAPINVNDPTLGPDFSQENPLEGADETDLGDDSDNSSSASNGSSGGSDDDNTPEPTQEQEQMLDGSTGDTSSGSGQGIGPSGVSGSEASTPDAETDAPTNDSTEGIEATKTGELEDIASDPRIRDQAQTLEEKLTGVKVTDAVDGLKTTGAELREEDVQVTRDGDTLRAELSPVGQERVGNIAQRQQQESLERELERELSRSFTGEDVSVSDDGEVEVSQNVRSTARTQRNRARSFRGTPNRQTAQNANTAESRGSVLAEDTPFSESRVSQGREATDTDTNEAFGGRGTAEQELRNALDFYERRVVDPVATSAGDIAAFRYSERNPLNLRPGEEAGELPDSGPSPQEAESTVRAIGNIPRLATAPIEAAEFVGAGVSQTAQGEGGEFVDKTANVAALRGAQLVQASQDSPEQLRGQLVGSTIGTFGLLKGARTVGGARTQRAASVAVQPGEEAAIFAARRGVPGTRRLANAVGDVDVGSQARRFRQDEGGQLGQSRSRSSSESDSSGSSSSGGGPTITAEDLGSTRAVADPTRGGRFGSPPSGGRQPDATTDVPSAGEPSSLGFRSARTEQERGGTAAESNRKPNQDLREQAEARQVTEPEAQTGAIENTAVGLLRGTEAQVGQDVTAGQEARQEAAQRPFAGTRVDSFLNSRPRTEPGVTNRVEPFVGTRLENRLETRVETGTEARQDTRQETRQEVRQETRTEARAESRIEPRIETRFETRTETDFDDDRGSNDDGNGRFPGLIGESEEVVTLFRNPLSGEVLDDSADGSSSVPGFGSSDNSGPDLGGFGL